MKVYLLRADSDSYESLLITKGSLFEFAGRFNGQPMDRPWTDVTIEADPKPVPKGDFPSLIPGVPVFSPRALHALEDLLLPNGEVLPAICAGEAHYLYNVTRVVDALDESRSDVVRLPGKSEALYISDHVFVADRVRGMAVFKIPQETSGDVFVTDLFVDRVETTGLTGFWFIPVWSSD